MSDFLDALGRGVKGLLGGFQDVAMQDKLGPDWRQKLAEAEAERQRRAEDQVLQREQAARAAADERVSLADKLASGVATMMEADPNQIAKETPQEQITLGGNADQAAGQVGIGAGPELGVGGGYAMN